MKIFRAEDERRICEIETARTWRRSGLISQEQLTTIEAQSGSLARAGIAIRLLFFCFAVLAQFSVVFYASWKLREETSIGLFLLVLSVFCWAMGEWLIRSRRLYRFGVEEALITGAGIHFCSGLAMLAPQIFPSLKTHAILLWSLPATAVCTAAYARYRYLYAGFGAIFFIACVVFGFEWTDRSSRLALAGLYGILLLLSNRRQDVPDYEQSRWDTLEACLFLGIYLILNLQLSGLGHWRSYWYAVFTQNTGAFYWATFAAIWLLPASWLYWGVRVRNRAAIDSGCLAALITLMTYKPYLGWERHVWDPAILGAFLMGSAIWLSRWLNSGADGKRSGFTARRFLQEKEDGFAAAQLLGASIASSAAVPGASASSEGFKGGGGSSGGAGASGGY